MTQLVSRKLEPRLSGILASLCLILFVLKCASAGSRDTTRYLAPTRIRVVKDDGTLVVLGSNGRRLVVVDPVQSRCHRSIPLPGPGSDVLVRGREAYVAVCQPAGQIVVVDLDTGAYQRRITVGHSPMAMTLSKNGDTLWVANRFDNAVDRIDLRTAERRSIPVVREPIALALSSDGAHLFVANHLPKVRPFLDDENPIIAAEVSVIDVASARLLTNIELPNGSQGLRDMVLSPDGQYVAVTHILSHFTMPTMQIEHGAINRNAVSLLDAKSLQWEDTVILDDISRGAANPWAIQFLPDGSDLLVTHAGTHELSVIDFPALLKRLKQRRPVRSSFDENELTLMSNIRHRIAVPVRGPRSLCVQDKTVHIAGYFSDDAVTVDLRVSPPTLRKLPLESTNPMPKRRLGEQYFNDASLCFQQWHSCGTCHPDGRSDALYWDLLNDGIGNTKNTKSLLMSVLTPPVTWRGVRPNAAAAIRAGMHHILFTEPTADQSNAIEEYLLTMPGIPGPGLIATQLETPKTKDASCAKCHWPGVPRGSLSAAARRGKQLFEGKAGCATCHPHPTFTSRRAVDPGLGTGVRYDIPSLVEVWRTAPYLHNGEALNLHETITNFNLLKKRGDTQSLNDRERADLLQYLRSL